MPATALVETLHHGILHARVDLARCHAFAQAEHTFDDTQLCGSGVKASHGHPVVDDHTGTDNVASPVDGTSNKRHL